MSRANIYKWLRTLGLKESLQQWEGSWTDKSMNSCLVRGGPHTNDWSRKQAPGVRGAATLPMALELKRKGVHTWTQRLCRMVACPPSNRLDTFFARPQSCPW